MPRVLSTDHAVAPASLPSLPPLPRRHEASRPYPALARLRLGLLGIVRRCKARGDGPALLHHPRIDVGAVRQRAYREHAPVLVEAPGVARQFLPLHMRAQLARGGFAASPGFSPPVGAGLIELGRIYSLEPYARSCDVDRVAVDHARAPDDDRVRLGMPVAIELIGDEARRDRNRDPQVDVAPPPRPAGGAPAPPRYGRAPQDLSASACAVHIKSLFYLNFTALALFGQNVEIG
jgi:hypothetical protein